jgi:hypothetical protein
MGRTRNFYIQGDKFIPTYKVSFKFVLRLLIDLTFELLQHTCNRLQLFAQALVELLASKEPSYIYIVDPSLQLHNPWLCD